MQLANPVNLVAVAAFILSFAVQSLGSSVGYNYVVKEAHPVPQGWKRVGPAPANHRLRVEVALKQPHFADLEHRLYAVSHPDSPQYGQHLSFQEITKLVQPSAAATHLVHQWLEYNGIERRQLTYSPANDWIWFELPIATLERLLQTKYSVYRHEDGTQIIRAPEYSLPQTLLEHVDLVSPTNSFFIPRVQYSNSLTVGPQLRRTMEDSDTGVGKVCDPLRVTPNCLRTFYGTIDYQPQAGGKNGIGLTDYRGESNNRSDVKLFLEQFRPEAVSAADSFKVEVINHGSNNQKQENATALEAGTELEGNLDAETILGIAYPTPLTAYSTGGIPPFDPSQFDPTNTNEPYLTWLHAVLQQDDLPQIISTSYEDGEYTVPLSYAKRVCESLAQLGARGITLLFASGDSGVGRYGDCVSNNGTNRTAFHVNFPSSCPYVTSVGATKNFNPEVVAYNSNSGYASGGGFSNYFARPSYQNQVVPAYVASLKGQYSGFFNPNGRAYPDISAQGYEYVTIWNGTTHFLSGTSAATPCAASILSLVNDALIAAGKKPLGFLNPWLYSRGHGAFSDITSGSAMGCNLKGFPATKGWDAVSGWGTPYFPKVKAAALGSYSSSK